jgi:hypothetical protein
MKVQPKAQDHTLYELNATANASPNTGTSSGTLNGSSASTLITKKCNHPRCLLCQALNETTKISSFASNRTYKCLSHDQTQATCNSSNVIYAITCNQCKKQYVGETGQKLNTRIGQHRRSVEGGMNIGCYRLKEHFKQGGICKDFSVTVLEKLVNANSNQETKEYRLRRETYWICLLRTKYPFGMNEKLPGYDIDTCTTDNMTRIIQELDPPPRRNKGRKKRKGRSHKDKSDSSDNVIDYINSYQEMSLKNLTDRLRNSNKKTLRNLINKIDHVTEKYRYCTMDVIASHLGNTDTVKPTIKPKKGSCYINYSNRAFDLYNVNHAIAKHGNCWPLNRTNYKTEFHKPNVIWRYKTPIRNILCNYTKEIKNLKLEDLCQMKCACNSNITNPYRDSFHGHIITGDYSFIRNKMVRSLFEKGPKHRVSQAMDIAKATMSLELDLRNYCSNVAARLNKCSSDFEFWINRVTKYWQQMATQRKGKVSVACNLEENFKLSNKAKKYLKWLHKYYIVTPVDKASQNLAIICKSFYFNQTGKELGLVIAQDGTRSTNSSVYRLINDNDVSQKITSTLRRNFNVTRNEYRELPIIYLIPKFHKYPIKFRTIIASKRSITKNISEKVGTILKKLQKCRSKYCDSIYRCTGYNGYWIIDNNKPIVNQLNQLSKINYARSIETYDFTTLYTTLEHRLILECMDKLVRSIMKDRHLSVDRNFCFWTNDTNEYSLCSSDVLNMIRFVIENIYFNFGNLTFKQEIGIPMGTNCAPQLANLMLHNLELEFVNKLRKDKKFELCRKFRYVYRYIDDITVINGNGILDEWFREIYPSSLNLEKVNNHNLKADVLDLGIEVKNKKFTYQTYDKRRDFNFKITNFPHITSNVPLRMCYNVFKDQIIRHFDLNSDVTHFVANVQLLVDNCSARGYHKDMLRFISKQAFHKNIDIKKKYGVSGTQVLKRLRFDKAY